MTQNKRSFQGRKGGEKRRRNQGGNQKEIYEVRALPDCGKRGGGGS